MVRFPQKLLIPSAARPLIERPAQLERLTEVIVAYRATMVVAPAGWGKTIALTQWVRIAPLPLAWYTIDSADRDPYQFMAYLLAAVVPFVPEATERAAQLSHARPHELPALFRDCAAAIAAAQQPFALIIDDFHLLTESNDPSSAEAIAMVMEFIATLIDYAPVCHLVLVSRTLPRTIPGLIRQVALQRVAVLDYLALQWSVEDLQRLASLNGAGALPLAQAADLVERYNGWVMGITLALDRLGPASSFAAVALMPDDTEQIYAFLAEQVIAPLPADLQHFLEQTSVLDDLSVARCNQLCERSDAAELLDELVTRGLFLSRRGGWLSYHSLFRDFLRARLARHPLLERTMLQRAADLYAAEDDLERAVTCYCAVAAWPQVHNLLRAAVPRFRQRSQQTLLLRCFDRLQEAVEFGAPRLPPDLLLAQARVYGDLAFWERAYVALQLIETTGDQLLRWEARILHADLLAIQGELAAARTVLAGIPPVEHFPPRLRLAARYTAGRLAILEGNIAHGLDLLNTAINDATPDPEAAARPETMAAIYDLLGYGHAVQQDIPTAMRCLQRAEAYWQLSGDGGRRALTLNNIGVLALDEQRLLDARSALTTALALAQQASRRREETIIRLSLADLDLVEGDLDGARTQSVAAYELALRTQVLADQAAAACGVGWFAALNADHEISRDWFSRLSDDGPLSALARGRRALAAARLIVADTTANMKLNGLIAEAVGTQTAFGPVERAVLALIQTHRALRSGELVTTEVDWEALDAMIGKLPEALLAALVAPHQAVVVAAPPTSLLARRLIFRPVLQTAPRWSITALGHFACLDQGRPCDLSALYRTLLIRLLEAGPPGIAVDRLWEDVWGAMPFSMSALHKALWRVREQTGLAAIARAGHCGIRSGWDEIAYDVQLFERALAGAPDQSALRRAIELYRGDFLPGSAPAAAGWVDSRRTYLQQRYLVAMEQLAHSCEEPRPEEAISLYQRILQTDRCREQTAARLMSLAARLGNHALVNATFAQLTESLQSLGITPLPSTISLYQHLR